MYLIRFLGLEYFAQRFNQPVDENFNGFFYYQVYVFGRILGVIGGLNGAKHQCLPFATLMDDFSHLQQPKSSRSPLTVI